jgi:hypothetical protein
MSQAVFHLGVTEADLNGATLAIIPGDPARVQKIAELMETPVFLASHREYTLYRAELDGKPVVVCSTGIGGPSTSIVVEELAQLGVRSNWMHGRLIRPFGSMSICVIVNLPLNRSPFESGRCRSWGERKNSIVHLKPVYSEAISMFNGTWTASL